MTTPNNQPVQMTDSTKQWSEALYEAGAMEFKSDTEVVLNPKIRELVSAMHAVLAGGEVKLDIVNEGSPVYQNLERHFEAAWKEISEAYAETEGTELPVFP